MGFVDLRFHTEQSCSWCHTMNATTVQRCARCGHDAHQPRMVCTCPRCQGGWQPLGLQKHHAEADRADQSPKHREVRDQDGGDDHLGDMRGPVRGAG